MAQTQILETYTQVLQDRDALKDPAMQTKLNEALDMVHDMKYVDLMFAATGDDFFAKVAKAEIEMRKYLGQLN